MYTEVMWSLLSIFILHNKILGRKDDDLFMLSEGNVDKYLQYMDDIFQIVLQQYDEIYNKNLIFPERCFICVKILILLEKNSTNIMFYIWAI